MHDCGIISFPQVHQEGGREGCKGGGRAAAFLPGVRPRAAIATGLSATQYCNCELDILTIPFSDRSNNGRAVLASLHALQQCHCCT